MKIVKKVLKYIFLYELLVIGLIFFLGHLETSAEERNDFVAAAKHSDLSCNVVNLSFLMNAVRSDPMMQGKDQQAMCMIEGDILVDKAREACENGDEYQCNELREYKRQRR